MEYHGWELVLLCFIKFYQISVWPAVAVTALWIFREQMKDGVAALMRKIEELIELKTGIVSAKFRPQPVKLAPLQVKDSGSLER
jgi:hypothetical protein